jgi:hypothetical protein
MKEKPNPNEADTEISSNSLNELISQLEQIQLDNGLSRLSVSAQKRRLYELSSSNDESDKALIEKYAKYLLSKQFKDDLEGYERGVSIERDPLNKDYSSPPEIKIRSSYLVKYAIDNNIKIDGYNPAKYAIDNNIWIDRVNPVKYAIDKGIKIGSLDPMQYAVVRNVKIGELNPLPYAASKKIPIDGLDPISYAIDRGIKINGYDPVMYAIDRGIKINEYDPVIYAINNKIKINGYDPVMYAINRGIKINEYDPVIYAIKERKQINGRHPLEYAENSSYSDLTEPVRYVIDNNIRINGRDPVDYALYKISSSRREIDPLRYAIDNNIKINEYDPVIYAIKEGRSIKGQNPIKYAIENKIELEGMQPMEYMIRNNLKISDVDPTIYAIRNKIKIGSFDPLQYAIKNGILINRMDPLEYAVKEKVEVEYNIPHDKKENILRKIIDEYSNNTDPIKRTSLEEKYIAIQQLGVKEKPNLLGTDSSLSTLLDNPKAEVLLINNQALKKNILSLDYTKCDIELANKYITFCKKFEIGNDVSQVRNYDNLSTIQKMSVSVSTIVPIIGNAVTYYAIKSYNKTKKANLEAGFADCIKGIDVDLAKINPKNVPEVNSPFCANSSIAIKGVSSKISRHLSNSQVTTKTTPNNKRGSQGRMQ